MDKPTENDILEIAESENKHPVDAMLDLAVADDLQATFITPPEKMDMNAMSELINCFRDRGTIREGAPADLVVYDYENLEVLPSERVADLPAGDWRRVSRAQGYRWILVNGEVTFEDGKCTNAIPGRLLRHGI